MFSSLTVECEIRSDVQIVGEREDLDEETWMPALSNIDLVLVEQVSVKSGESEQVSIKFASFITDPGFSTRTDTAGHTLSRSCGELGPLGRRLGGADFNGK